MIQTCNHCQTAFEITKEDLEFYDKISPIFHAKKYQIPPPTLCPDCRQQRRLVFRNERNLYHRKCDFSGKDIISMYSPDKPCKVYDQEVWWSDKWDALEYGKDFDFNRSFFQQHHELSLVVPRPALLHFSSENSSYTSHSVYNKNCYMCINTGYSEDLLYCSNYNIYNKNCVDCLAIQKCEVCYYCVNTKNCFHSFYLYHCENCYDAFFCYDCKSCRNCFGCYNLRQKEYCLFNKQYSSEEYKKKFEEIMPRTWSEFMKTFQHFWNRVHEKAIHQAVVEEQCEKSSGDYLIHTKNVHQSYYTFNGEDCKYCYDAGEIKNCYDVVEPYRGELEYETHACNINYNMIGCSKCYENDHLMYCQYCWYSSHLFGCFGLRRKQYCILNKQYTKEEYEELVPKIIEHMGFASGGMKIPLSTPLPPLTGGQEKDFNSGEQKSLPASFLKREEYVSSLKKGIYPSPPVKGDLGGYEWGEFFPAHLSPFGYNETVANEYYPLTREQVLGTSDASNSVGNRHAYSLQHGQIFNWSDYEPPKPDVKKIIPAEKLPDDIKKIPDDILNWAIECEVTKKPFRIIKQELEFYRQHNLPIPRRHPDQRHFMRMRLRNPRKLWKRNCMKCKKEIQTTYAPDRKEIVYCEECYLKEVY